MIMNEELLDWIKKESIKAEGVNEAIAEGKRTWEECEQYIVSVLYKRAKEDKIKANGCSFGAASGLDSELVGMAIHYFTEENLEEWTNIFKSAKASDVVAGPSAKKPAEPSLFDGMDIDIAPVKPKAKTVTLKPAKPKKVNVEDNPNQLTLF